MVFIGLITYAAVRFVRRRRSAGSEGETGKKD